MVSDIKYRGHWSEVRSRILNKYKNLSESDLNLQRGREDEFLGRLEQKLGISKSEIREMISKA